MNDIDYSTMPDYPEDQPQEKKTVLDELKALSAVSRIEKMEANLSKDTFVFNEMALDGQISLFQANPNTGKTLFFLRFIMDSQARHALASIKILGLHVTKIDSPRVLLAHFELEASGNYSPPPSGADSDREKFLAEHIYRFAALLDGQFSWYFIHKTCR